MTTGPEAAAEDRPPDAPAEPGHGPQHGRHPGDSATHHSRTGVPGTAVTPDPQRGEHRGTARRRLRAGSSRRGGGGSRQDDSRPPRCVQQQVTTEAPTVAATGWALHGRVYTAQLEPAVGYCVFLVDAQNAYYSPAGSPIQTARATSCSPTLARPRKRVAQPPGHRPKQPPSRRRFLRKSPIQKASRSTSHALRSRRPWAQRHTWPSRWPQAISPSATRPAQFAAPRFPRGPITARRPRISSRRCSRPPPGGAPIHSSGSCP